ncbi:hypothetical protein [Rhizobium sp. L43]|uniref:hypothetical protein n=1 Tax=Rhizobium sp. L43 TaxID=2035452 RepID=UPI000BE7FEE6|nr:hypothetical protein [Rhizobium sp. L43]PDS75445.1 hypothetical protein CO667_26550 [Rhizobium sp. L43]
MLESVTAFLLSIGINPTHFVAGVAGAGVRSLLNKGASKWEKISGGFVGTFCAVYLTPLFVQWMNLDATNLSTTNAVAFGIGIIGMSLAEGAVRMAQNWSEKPRLPTEASLKGLADAVNPQEPPAIIVPPIDCPEDEKPEPHRAPVRKPRRRS